MLRFFRHGWLLNCLLFLVLLSPALLATPSPTKEHGNEKLDENVTYVIIAVVLVFFVSVVVVVVVSIYQTRRRPVSRNYAARMQSSQIACQENAPQRNEAVLVDGDSEQPSSWWEIPKDELTVYHNNALGSGQFGVILLGEVLKNNTNIKCAVKTLKQEATEADKRSLRMELKNMANMDPHPNIVNLIGAQTLFDNFFVVVEYCSNGDLYNYVRAHRTDLSIHGKSDSGTRIDIVVRLRIAFDVANGMNYLSTKGFIHRDLAARNVLLEDELRAKVSDFGRSRDIGETFQIFQSVRKNEPIPTRWMPVETLRCQIFTTKSDVWSFGVLLWEVESGGLRPYNDQETYRQVVDKVVYQGYRLQQPSYCPDVIYQIMSECWKIDPEERPTFKQLALNLGNLLKAHLPPQYSSLPS